MSTVRYAILFSALIASLVVGVSAQSAPVPVPRPFPGSTPSSPSAPRPAEPAAAAPVEPVIAVPKGQAAPEGTPVYPSAEFLDSYDAGSGQRYYLYGTDTPFADIVTYYKNVLRNGGREIYRTPP